MSLKMKDILENILYNTSKCCFLCFSSLDPENSACMSDEITVSDTDISKELYEMLNTILGTSMIQNISKEDLICQNCVLLATNAYQFIEACKWNLNMMNNLISNVIASAIEVNEPEIGQTAFLLVNPHTNSAEVYLETANNGNDMTLTDVLAKIKHFKENPLKDCEKENDFLRANIKVEKQYPTPIALISNLNREPNPKGPRLTIHCGAVAKTQMDQACKIIKKTKYQCKHCFTKFPSFDTFQYHCMKIHGKVIENSGVLVDDNMSYSVVTRNEEMIYKCSACSETYTNFNALKQHFMTVHELKSTKYTCFICIETFKTRYLWRNHVNTHYRIENDTFECSLCLKSIMKRNYVIPHFNKVHNNVMLMKDYQYKRDHSKVRCTICGQSFITIQCLKTHLKSHRSEEITCQKCNKKYRNYATFKNHFCNPNNAPKRHERNIQCDYCGKKYINKKVLRAHIRYMHLSEGIYCQVCNKRFETKSNLQYHLLVHTKEKNFHCTVCGGRFGVEAALRSHMRLHTGETPYPCDKCELKFSSASRRADHFRRHHGEPNKVCEICGKKFYDTSCLTKHKARHYNGKSRLSA